jgi:hypothetical protein
MQKADAIFDIYQKRGSKGIRWTAFMNGLLESRMP